MNIKWVLRYSSDLNGIDSPSRIRIFYMTSNLYARFIRNLLTNNWLVVDLINLINILSVLSNICTHKNNFIFYKNDSGRNRSLNVVIQ